MQPDVQSIITAPEKKSGKGLVLGILAVIVVLAGVGVGIYLVSQNQEIREKAAGEATCAWTARSSDCLATESWCQKDLRCYPADKAAKVNCNDEEPHATINKRINEACGTTDKGSETTTICGKTQTWKKFDADLKTANFPGPYIHGRTEARAYIGASCPETLIGTPTTAPTATPAPTAQPTSTPSSTSTPTPTRTPTPVPTTRTYIPPTDQGIPQTGTGLPTMLGVSAGIILILGAFILAL